jgi:hypothetical protein
MTPRTSTEEQHVRIDWKRFAAGGAAVMFLFGTAASCPGKGTVEGPGRDPGIVRPGWVEIWKVPYRDATGGSWHNSPPLRGREAADEFAASIRAQGGKTLKPRLVGREPELPN